MAEKVPIQERIIRQLVADMTTLADTVEDGRAAYRVDDPDAHPGPGDILVCPHDATERPGAIGNPGTVVVTLPVTVYAIILREEGVTSTSVAQERWRARIIAALAENWRIAAEVGETTVNLAVQSTVKSCPGPDYEEGFVPAAVQIDIEFEHDWGDPYQLGTLIADLEE